MPETPVVAVVTPPAKLPLAPDPGAVNVTLAPETGLLPTSLTVTARAFVNAVEMVALCGVVPALVAIVAAAPTVMLKAELVAGVNPGPEEAASV